MDIIGHRKMRETLRKIAESESSHQAFLFFGPEGVGKTLIAKEFASECMGFGGIDPSVKQDFLIIAPERTDGGGGRISVDRVRELSIFLSRFPAEAKRRVAVIEDADMLSEQGQNAILKSFEEPNQTSIIILVTSRAGALPDTVRSRAFQVPFGLVSEEEIRDGIPSVFSGSSVLSLEPFFFSLGRPGIIARAVGDAEAFSLERGRLRDLFRISALPIAERLRLSEELSQNGAEAARILEWWISGLRNLRKNETDRKRLRAYYGLFEEGESVIRSIRVTNANTRLLLDRFLLSL